MWCDVMLYGEMGAMTGDGVQFVCVVDCPVSCRS